MADKFVLKTPKGELVKVRMPNGEVKMEIRWNPNFGPSMTQRINSAQVFIDTECLKLCDPLVPKDTGILKQSGIMHTSIGSGKLKYRTPYARRWYYIPAKFSEAPERGNYWFERMKIRHKEHILARSRKIAKAQGD